ncbi:alpha/beta hydrolase [Streptomyces sp. XD-27]|uniref:alpha/beta hydrolase family protein n=1 Tax=Streptomyces sp. XD-27 TaxID=3062779 RepID=UPI0026F4383B|nr:alpha/beta hydrolase [Streptomyces sp. XD-27]WKX72708.1 alpha/beta hydrolase [Streptomyces sp. XD-27]
MVSRRTVARSAAGAAAAAAAAGLLLAGGTGAARAQADGTRARTADAARAQAAARSRARSAGGVTVRLPAPTGRHRVGATTLYLVDKGRRDPWQPAIPVREVMATVFYPARTVRGYPVAPQISAGAVRLFPQIDVPMRHLPTAGVNWAATMTHAHTDAPAQPVRRPVLLYSPGGGDPRTVGTSLAEELASHGWVVVAVDHPGDASEVEFPNERAGRGQVRETVFFAPPTPEQFRTMIDTRVADLAFVLDRLAALAAGRNPDAAGRPLPESLDRALDLRRVGVYGHSAGGTAVAEAMYEDRRIGAAVDLEGYLDYPPDENGRPGSCSRSPGTEWTGRSSCWEPTASATNGSTAPGRPSSPTRGAVSAGGSSATPRTGCSPTTPPSHPSCRPPG